MTSLCVDIMNKLYQLNLPLNDLSRGRTFVQAVMTCWGLVNSTLDEARLQVPVFVNIQTAHDGLVELTP